MGSGLSALLCLHQLFCHFNCNMYRQLYPIQKTGSAPQKEMRNGKAPHGPLLFIDNAQENGKHCRANHVCEPFVNVKRAKKQRRNSDRNPSAVPSCKNPVKTLLDNTVGDKFLSKRGNRIDPLRPRQCTPVPERFVRTEKSRRHIKQDRFRHK